MPPEQALAAWLQLFVRHVATKRGMLSLLKPMLSTNTTFSDQSAGAPRRGREAPRRRCRRRDDPRRRRRGDLLRAVGGICMSTDQERSEASERLVGLLFDGLRHGVAGSPTLRPGNTSN